ncbi:MULTISPECIES: GspE/PulE family protein [Candidatus Ichthyocystis]|uniref:General secretion pathway protein E n=1 Tax=Candidatus Ichthyocystis hellenicum TaxID=1561003 RepID=A0A0S4M4L0_9BURK|nr:MULTISPECIES: ATPase, T2SS/T4P/T4SS family [Ichthyocystis]CUT17213.1 type II secretion system protein E [Candidatus Ichthyocystis hellenicum]
MSTDLSYAYSRLHNIIILEDTVFVTATTNLVALNEVFRFYEKCFDVHVLLQSEFDQRLAVAYSDAQSRKSASDVVDAAGEELDLTALFDDMPVKEDLLNNDNDAPIVRTINALLTQAVRDRASDIHIEPFEKSSLVRFRIDGLLVNIAQPRRSLHAPIVSRIKVMAKMDIAEKRLPQDGRIAVRLGNRQVDVRVSTLPTVYGERVVVRLLDKDAGVLSFRDLGLSDDIQMRINRILAMPHGILLVTGPTGSGKTTTLYAALKSFTKTTQKNIMTVEDPVEYDLEGVSQTSVNVRIGMNFSRALRSILRQDPDVVMIGEIRDVDTAQIAVQASLTGHFVLATLHTNDSLSAVTRLRDMGIEPFLLAPVIRGVLAQRLVRRVCHQCRKFKIISPALSRLLSLPEGEKVPEAVGCDHCRFSGYSGRVGVFELLEITPLLESMIHSCASEQTLREKAFEQGFITLREYACHLIREGLTTPEEVLSLGRETEDASL